MQYAVALRLVSGKKTREIWKELTIHRTSGERHVRRLFVTLGIQSKPELIAYAKEHGVFI